MEQPLASRVFPKAAMVPAYMGKSAFTSLHTFSVVVPSTDIAHQGYGMLMMGWKMWAWSVVLSGQALVVCHKRTVYAGRHQSDW